MIEVIRLPEISENVKSGDVIEVLVKVGDLIEQEQPIVELETEKATFEVPSPTEGKVVEINIKQGQMMHHALLIYIWCETRNASYVRSIFGESEKVVVQSNAGIKK